MMQLSGFGCILPAAGRIRAFQPLELTLTERTSNKGAVSKRSEKTNVRPWKEPDVSLEKGGALRG